MPNSRIPFITNEQYVSADLNAVQRVSENALEELAGYLHRPIALGATGGALGFGNPATAVLGGLDATTDGSASLIVGPGMLQTTLNSTTDNPSASGTWLALNAANATIPIPSPVADTWYLVGGSPKLTDAPAEARNVFDPPNHALISPTPSLVKRQNVGINFTVAQCTTADLTSGGFTDPNAVLLYAVFRPGGGGPINAGLDIVDLRPSVPSPRPVAGSSIVHNQWRYDSTGLKLTVRLQLDDVELYASNSSVAHPRVDPMDFINPADALPVANEWWYLYLARYRPLGDMVAPRNGQPALLGIRQQGLLIFSKVAPYSGNGIYGNDTLNARRNSAVLHAPEPYSDTAIAIGDAVCFGALRSNPTNTGWVSAQCDGDRVLILNDVTNDGQAFPNTTPTLLAGVPPMARTVDLQVLVPPASGGAGSSLYIANAAGTTRLYRSLGVVSDIELGAITAATGGETRGLSIVDMPLAENGLTFLLNLSNGTTGGDPKVLARGYRF